MNPLTIHGIRRRPAARALMATVAIALGLAGLAGDLAPAARAAAAGETESAAPSTEAMPAFEKAPVRKVSLKELKDLVDSKKGHPVLVVFWATWCGPCIKEIPTIKESLQRYGKDGLSVIGLSMDGLNGSDEAQSIERVSGFAGMHGMDYEILYFSGDADALGREFDWSGVIPFATIFDDRGKAVSRMNGVVPAEKFLGRVDTTMKEAAKRSAKKG